MTFQDQMLAQRLGFFGLIPFILLAAGPWVFYEHTAVLLQAFRLYSALILAFTAGILWGVRLSGREPGRNSDAAGLWVAAGIAGVALASLFIPTRLALVALVAAFIFLLQWERRTVFPVRAEDGYAAMRQRLTWTAVACHLLAFWNLWLPPAQV